MSRYTAAAIAAVLLFAAAGHTAFAQTRMLQVTAANNAQGHVVLTATSRTGYDLDSNDNLSITRCEVPTGAASCDPATNMDGTAIVQPVGGNSANAYTDTSVEIGKTYIYRWNDIGVTPAFLVSATTEPITATVVGGGDAVDDAVLPNVLRNTTHGIQRGIYQRILQRQREDGRWK